MYRSSFKLYSDYHQDDPAIWAKIFISMALLLITQKNYDALYDIFNVGNDDYSQRVSTMKENHLLKKLLLIHAHSHSDADAVYHINKILLAECEEEYDSLSIDTVIKSLSGSQLS